MTNKEAITWLCGIRDQFTGNCTTDTLVPISRCDIQAIELAIKALEIVDDVNHKIYRNENCPQKNRCYDYQGYHCAGCNWGVKNNGQI